MDSAIPVVLSSVSKKTNLRIFSCASDGFFLSEALAFQVFDSSAFYSGGPTVRTKYDAGSVVLALVT